MNEQSLLADKILSLYPNAEVKKVNRDNFVDIHLPLVHEKRGTHLFFNTSKGKIKLGFYCREDEFVSKALAKSELLEAYAQGVRLKANPEFANVDDAVNAARTLVEALTGNAGKLQTDDKNLAQDQTRAEENQKYEDQPNEPIEALAYLFLEMVFVDGQPTKTEIEAVAEVLYDLMESDKQVQILSKRSSTDSIIILKYCLEKYVSKQSDILIVSAVRFANEYLSQEEKTMLMNMLVYVAKADGEITEQEKNYYNHLLGELGLK
jgi:uncharacterized tellurite resistance protein B-like protein